LPPALCAGFWGLRDRWGNLGRRTGGVKLDPKMPEVLDQSVNPTTDIVEQRTRSGID
jgi:hypothetical protein